MQPRISIIFLLTILVLTTSPLFAGQKIASIRIELSNKKQLQDLRALHLDNLKIKAGFATALATASDFERLSTAGLAYTIEIDDMTAYFQSRFDKSLSMGGYRTLAEIELVLDSIYTENTDIVAPKASIGQSIEGRDIWVLKISDNPLIDEAEPEIFYFAAMHAREVITPEVLIYFMRYLTDNYPNNIQVKYLVENREMFFATNLNPDGYYWNEVTNPGGGGLWRKNRRLNWEGSHGVDLNRNYGYQWGYDDLGSSPIPSDNTYRGTGPFSEPETQAARDFIIAHNFAITVSYHSFSNLFLYPWGYDYLNTEDNDIFVAMGDTVAAMNGYAPGPAWGLYKVNGDTDDWGYGEQTLKNKNYAFTPEVGSSSDNFWPPTNRITPLVQENLQPNLFYARIAGNPEILRPPSSPTIYTVGNIDTSFFDLYWHHQDTLNPAVSYIVWQYEGAQRIIDDLEESNNWELHGFSFSNARAYSGLQSLYSGSINYANNTVQTSEPIAVAAADSLKFQTWYDIENSWDYGYVQVSSDGGSNWINLPGNITTTGNPNGNNIGNGITGNSGGWVEARFDLSNFVGKEINLRFQYITDSYVTGEGWYLDDIGPLDVFAQISELASAATDTSLFVDSLSEGTYLYRVSARDAEGQLSAKSGAASVSVLFNSGCGWLIGDADNSGIVNISDAVYLLEYVFNGGLAPTPKAIGSGDADCSGYISVTDAVYIVLYVFKGGPQPGATCSCSDY